MWGNRASERASERKRDGEGEWCSGVSHETEEVIVVYLMKEYRLRFRF